MYKNLFMFSDLPLKWVVTFQNNREVMHIKRMADIYVQPFPPSH